MNMNLLLLILMGISFILHVCIAALMGEIAERKGYGEKGSDVHAIAKCFFLGIGGWIYVFALPNLKEQALYEKIAVTLEILKIKKDGK